MNKFGNIIRVNGEDYVVKVLPSGTCICIPLKDYVVAFKNTVSTLFNQPVFSCSWDNTTIEATSCNNWGTENSLGIDWKTSFDVKSSYVAPPPRKVSKKEQELLEKSLIRMDLCEAGFARNKRPKSRSRLVNLFYLQQKCFERSIESLGRFHRLGIYREERKTI